MTTYSGLSHSDGVLPSLELLVHGYGFINLTLLHYYRGTLIYSM